jgi:predicted ATPase/DNA-binding winged helix-turn-helix (wHTH) protein
MMPAQGLQPAYASSDYEIDLVRRELRVFGSPVPIGARAFEIIEVLVEAGGQLVTKDALMDRIWPGAIVTENALQMHISAIRKALRSNGGLLKTVSGRGYRLLGDWAIRPHRSRETPVIPFPQSVGSVDLPPMRDAPEAHRGNLPVFVTDLVGRSAGLALIRELLSAYRIVTLTGPGGIGKTALALHAARGLAADFNDESWLVELASLSDPNLVPSAVAAALGLRLGDIITSESVAQAIGTRRLLLLLDNCEHVIDAAAELVEMLVRHCSRVTILVTSRETLRIEGEYVYRVPPLEVPAATVEEADELLGHSSIQFFITRMQGQDSSFKPDPVIVPLVAQICRHLDGIPLAIEFAVARATALGLQQVAAMLDDRFHLLTSGRRTALPRHQTLRATLDWSYQLLSPDEAAVLSQLAVFAGDFSIEAATAVAHATPVCIAELVAKLAAKSLIVVETHGGITRHHLLETIRLYALEKTRGTDEIKEARRRHAEYYYALFFSADANSETQPEAEWLAAYGEHLDNVRTALDWAFSSHGNLELGVALTAAVVPLWVQLSLLEECRVRVEAALANMGDANAGSERLRMQLSAALAWALEHTVGHDMDASDAWAAAGEAWGATLELAERLGDRAYRLRALWGQYNNAELRAEFRRAFEYAGRFMALADESGDVTDVIMGGRILATALHYLGDQIAARHHIANAIAVLIPSAKEPRAVPVRFDMRVSSYYFHARILWLQGLLDQAMGVVARSIEEGRTIGHALSLASVLGQAACPISLLAGDLDAAARYGATLIEHTERHRIRLWQIWARCLLSLISIRRGEITEGLSILRGELERAGKALVPARFTLVLGEFSACLGEVGQIAEGIVSVNNTLDRCKTRDEGWYLPELLRIKGELLLKDGTVGSVANAKDCFYDALQLAQRQGALFWELRNALSLARLLVAEARLDNARQVLVPVYLKFREGFNTADMIAARALLDGGAADNGAAGAPMVGAPSLSSTTSVMRPLSVSIPA